MPRALERTLSMALLTCLLPLVAPRPSMVTTSLDSTGFLFHAMRPFFDRFYIGMIHRPYEDGEAFNIIRWKQAQIGFNFRQRDKACAKPRCPTWGQEDKRILYVEKIRKYLGFPQQG